MNAFFMITAVEIDTKIASREVKEEFSLRGSGMGAPCDHVVLTTVPGT